MMNESEEALRTILKHTNAELDKLQSELTLYVSAHLRVINERDKYRKTLERISNKTNTCVGNPDDCNCSQHLAGRALRNE